MIAFFKHNWIIYHGVFIILHGMCMMGCDPSSQGVYHSSGGVIILHRVCIRVSHSFTFSKIDMLQIDPHCERPQ